jgi:hypothetical protein
MRVARCIESRAGVSFGVTALAPVVANARRCSEPDSSNQVYNEHGCERTSKPTDERQILSRVYRPPSRFKQPAAPS